MFGTELRKGTLRFHMIKAATSPVAGIEGGAGGSEVVHKKYLDISHGTTNTKN